MMPPTHQLRRIALLLPLLLILLVSPPLCAAPVPDEFPPDRERGPVYGHPDDGPVPGAPVVKVRRIEKVVISGNGRTLERVIRRELLLSEGDVFDEVPANISRLRLLRLGFFRRVRMSLGKGADRDWVVWHIRVEERPTLLFTSDNQGFVGLSAADLGFGVGDINFGGRGQTALAGFKLRRDHLVGSLGWSDPHFLGTDLIVGFRSDLFHMESQVHGPGGDGSAIEARGFTLAPFVGMRTRRFSRLVAGFKVARATQEYAPDSLPALQPGPYEPHVRVVALGAVYNWSRKNDLFMPSEGMELTVSFENGFEVLGGTHAYRKLLLDGSAVYPVAPRQLAQVRLVGGAIGGEAPFFERFHLADLVRGIRNHRDPWRDAGMALQLEYRYIFHRSRYRFIDHWELLGFFDAGNTWPRDDVELDRLVWSVGVGARFDTGIGIISLVGAIHTSYDHNDW
jgi:outer membrane protein insertion porin family